MLRTHTMQEIHGSISEDVTLGCVSGSCLSQTSFSPSKLRLPGSSEGET